MCVCVRVRVHEKIYTCKSIDAVSVPGLKRKYFLRPVGNGFRRDATRNAHLLSHFAETLNHVNGFSIEEQHWFTAREVGAAAQPHKKQ
jgi:hypothetical protein